MCEAKYVACPYLEELLSNRAFSLVSEYNYLAIRIRAKDKAGNGRRQAVVVSRSPLKNMESPLDLSVVKKEPGLAICPSDSGIFDNMMSDEFHDSTFHSMVSSQSVTCSVVKLSLISSNGAPCRTPEFDVVLTGYFLGLISSIIQVTRFMWIGFQFSTKVPLVLTRR